VNAPRLAASGLAWAVGAHYILLDLDLALQPSELVVLRGDNGAGKTTLLHLLAGRMTPTAGDVLLAGKSLSQLDPGYVGSRIGWLGHKPGLYLDLTARENLLLFARVAGQPLAAEQAAEHLRAVGLRDTDHDRVVRVFSRGMMQRTGLARVAVTGADIWLLDEPMTGLDALGRTSLLARLRDAATAGVTVFCASHDAQLAAAADRVLQLASGHIAHDTAGGAA
jgi:heme ABC exporter ATP-binding subunit CcmA